METKHTPGPWHIARETFGEDKRIVGDCNVVRMSGPCDAVVVSLGADMAEQNANARLIASAPDVLAALEAIRARTHGEYDHPALVAYGPLSDVVTDCAIIAHAAIQKARGE